MSQPCRWPIMFFWQCCRHIKKLLRLLRLTSTRPGACLGPTDCPCGDRRPGPPNTWAVTSSHRMIMSSLLSVFTPAFIDIRHLQALPSSSQASDFHYHGSHWCQQWLRGAWDWVLCGQARFITQQFFVSVTCDQHSRDTPQCGRTYLVGNSIVCELLCYYRPSMLICLSHASCPWIAASCSCPWSTGDWENLPVLMPQCPALPNACQWSLSLGFAQGVEFLMCSVDRINALQ